MNSRFAGDIWGQSQDKENNDPGFYIPRKSGPDTDPGFSVDSKPGPEIDQGFNPVSSVFKPANFDDNISNNDFLSSYLNKGSAYGTNYDDVSMTKGDARKIFDRLTNAALNKNITPDVFNAGLYELSNVSKSTDYTRRNIRNALASPAATFAIENPDLTKELVNQFRDQIKSFGVNPQTLNANSSTAIELLNQAKRDNLIRDDVTNEEIKKQIQGPMYNASREWLRGPGSSPAVGNLLMKTPLRVNVGGSVKNKEGLSSIYFR